MKGVFVVYLFKTNATCFDILIYNTKTCKHFKSWCPNTFCHDTFENHLDFLFILEIQRCDDARLRHLHSVLQQVQNDILLQKAQLLQGTINLLQETLNEDEMRNNAFGKSERP